MDYVKKLKYNEVKEKGKDSLEYLLYFLVSEEENIKELYKGDETMEIVIRNMEDLSRALDAYLVYDPDILYELATKREREEAIEKGIEENKKEMAKTMLKENESLEKIIKYTGLSKCEIEELTNVI